MEISRLTKYTILRTRSRQSPSTLMRQILQWKGLFDKSIRIGVLKRPYVTTRGVPTQMTSHPLYRQRLSAGLALDQPRQFSRCPLKLVAKLVATIQGPNLRRHAKDPHPLKEQTNNQGYLVCQSDQMAQMTLTRSWRSYAIWGLRMKRETMLF